MTGGRAVVVTAGASGIGLAIVNAFAANGDRVHVCDVNEEAVARTIQGRRGITSSVCDISDQAAVERFIQEATKALGGIDVLVNNAGISGPTASVEDMEPDAWEAVLAVNLTGTFRVTRLAIPHLKASGAGVIINMASVGGRFGYPDRSPYATTKRGVIALTETLALELGGDGVRVNAIAPGAVDGDRIQRVLRGRAEASGRSLQEVTADALSIQALKHFVDPDDIASLTLFLCSDSAKSISGQTIAIDGFSKAAQ